MMNVHIKPASYFVKQDTHQIVKNGYIAIDFTPINESKDNEKPEILAQQKKTIILTMKNLGELLALDTKSPYNAEVDEEGTFV